MAQLFANNVATKLATAAQSTDSNIAVLSTSGMPTLVGSDFFLLTLAEITEGAETAWEIVKVTAINGNNLTIVRAQEGTTARFWEGGTKAEMRLTAESLSLKTVNGTSLFGVGNITTPTTTVNNTLTSTSTTEALSAAQGKVLQDSKLAASSYTAADVLTKIKTVDGSGSGLDADLLDGAHATDFNKIQGNLSGTAIDFNNLTSHGTYHQPVNGGTVTYTNAPVGVTNTSRFILTNVMATGDDFLQIVSVQDGPGMGRMFMRHHQDATWFVWVEVWTSARSGTANGIATLDATGKVPSGQLPDLNYIPTSQKAAANGVASLDATGRLPEAQLPLALEQALITINGV